MRDQELEQRLRTAVEHAAPDPLERILSSCDTQKGTVIPMTNDHKKKSRWTSLAVAAALAVMLCGGFGLHGWQTAHAVASVVSLDVNPSIQLQVNQKENVLSAEAMNADAEAILEGMDLKGTQLNVAVNAIVGSLLQHGYLDSLSSAILISVEDDDAQRASRLEASLTDEVNAALQNASAGAAILSQVVTCDADLETQAQANSISVGKAAMIQEIQALNSALPFDDLAALSVEELKQLRETGAPGLPIGKDAAAYAAEKYAGTLEMDSITSEVDAELDEIPAHYEVKLRHLTLGKFEYLVDAYTGEVLRGTADILSSAPASSGAPVTTASISESKAKSIALKDAGVTEGDTYYCNAWLEYDDGRPDHYEVEFKVGSIRYEYEIGLYDGSVLDYERADTGSGKVSDSGKKSSASAASFIGEEAAKNAAFSHAGVSASNVSKLKCELHEEDGSYRYQVEFQAGGTEYEYEIDAATGAVLEFESESHGK